MSDLVSSLSAFPTDLHVAYPQAELVWGVLEASLTGLALYSPLHDAQGHLVDFRIDLLNPAAQRILQQPARPTGTYLQHYPHTLATGVFAFHRDAFESDTPARLNVNYQADGLDNYFQLSARRVGQGLLVSFTDTADAARTEVELALRQSQAQEQAARADAELQRQQLYNVLQQAPAMICLFEGPEHTFQFVNPSYQALVGDRPILGKSIAEAMPELAGQPIFGLLDQVYRTGETYYANEMLVQLDHDNEGVKKLERRYYNFIYQARHNLAGIIDGIFVFAYDVTPLVLARHEVQNLNGELAATNEELHASNEEYLTANTALQETQYELQQLNQELEARVAERTQTALTLQADLLAAAQQQAQEREQLYQLFAETPAAICIQRGPEHRYAYANQAYQNFFPGRELLGRTVAAVLPETVAGGVVDLLDHVYQTGETYYGYELPLLIAQPDGRPPQQMHFTFTYQALRENGVIVGISTFAYDVAEQVRARQRVEAQQQELAHLFMQAPAPIVILDGPNLVFQLINPAYQRIFPGRELAGKPLLEALPELVGTPIPDLFWRVYQTGEPVTVHELPLLMARHEGHTAEEIYWTFTYQARRTTDERIDGVRVFAHDVTEQVRTRQQVERLNHELASINEELVASNEELHESNTQLTRTNVDLDNFIYTASHDLKAPISNIEGLLYLLREELPIAITEGEYIGPTLTRMLEAVERFKRTLDHLTEVSKLQKEHAPATQAVSLATVVEDVRQDLALLIQETGVRLLVEVSDFPPVQFSEKNLRSVVYNLLSNALKYRSPDRSLHVDVRAHVRAGYTVLEVHDNGLGIDPKHLPKLFTMFQRFHTHVEGTGIGLYMVKRMIDNAGGRLEVHSQPGAGTTFFAHLPHATGTPT